MPPIKTPGTIASLFWAPETPDQPTMRASTTFERLHDLYAALRDYVPLLPENDIQPLATVLQSRGAAAEESAALPAVRQTLKAFHGSPHDFGSVGAIGAEQGGFDIRRIGTGQGAQSFGHGLYAAENEAVAESIRHSESIPEVIIGGQKKVVPQWSTDLSPEERLIRRLSDKRALDPKRDQASIVADIRSELQREGTSRGFPNPHWPTDAQMASVKEQQRLLSEYEKQGIKTQHGHMYELRLHTSPDELLDWDKPLSQQPQKVQEAVKSLHGELSPRITKAPDWLAPSGRHVYEDLTSAMPGDWSPERQAKAAEKLKQAGIKGIQYLDQGSRMNAGVQKLGNNWFFKGSSTPYPTEAAAQAALDASGQVSRNFVIFDDTIIEIAKKYGISLPAAASLYKWQQSQKTQKGVE